MANEIIFYRTPDGEQRSEVVFRDEIFWMSQKALADLFGVGIPAINKHLANIHESGELREATTVSKMEIVRLEGTREVRRKILEVTGWQWQDADVSDFDREVNGSKALPSTRPERFS